MSNTDTEMRALARAAQSLIKGVGAQFAGRERGPDHGEGRRVPRKHSYDVDDAKAQPWRPVCDGSVKQGLVHREALMQTAQERYHEDWKALPAADVRRARKEQAALAAELEALDANPATAPIGRRATISIELRRLEPMLKRARMRLRRVDLTVLLALLKKIDFASGRLFPSLETIAEDAGCHRNAAIHALGRLKHHGLVSWVRRTVKTGHDGEFAPQREQTSNAYFFEHRGKMAPTTWQRFWQILTHKLRRLGAVPAGIAPAAPKAPKEIQDPAMRAAFAGLGSSLPSVST